MREGANDRSRDEWDDAVAESVWIAGVDYVKGFAEARAAVAAVSAALVQLGCAPDCFHATPGTGRDGAGVVRMLVSPAATLRLAGVLRQAARRSHGGLNDPITERCLGHPSDE
jgi:hypothetical protein